MSVPEISQRDLRLRSKEIMDGVERGESFVVTRDGRGIAELTPIREPRRFVARVDFVRGSRLTPKVDLEGFRRDLDGAVMGDLDDPYAQ